MTRSAATPTAFKRGRSGVAVNCSSSSMGVVATEPKLTAATLLLLPNGRLLPTQECRSASKLPLFALPTCQRTHSKPKSKALRNSISSTTRTLIGCLRPMSAIDRATRRTPPGRGLARQVDDGGAEGARNERGRPTNREANAIFCQ